MKRYPKAGIGFSSRLLLYMHGALGSMPGTTKMLSQKNKTKQCWIDFKILSTEFSDIGFKIINYLIAGDLSCCML